MMTLEPASAVYLTILRLRKKQNIEDVFADYLLSLNKEELEHAIHYLERRYLPYILPA
jgi:hypothetical protein